MAVPESAHMALAVAIRLLGAPSVEVNGTPAAGPRGRKSWAVLALLALSRRPRSRREVADLIFASAEDPLAALRWTLAEIRRAVGREDLLRGDPLRLDTGEDVTMDVLALDGASPDALTVAETGGELLPGWDFPDSPALETWLMVARRHARARAEAVLRDAAMRYLAGGDIATAVRLAARAVELNPLDDALQELLIRSLARGGDGAAAHEQLARFERQLIEELGTRPSPAVRAAANDGPARIDGRLSSAAAAALVAAGRAAIDAGALDAGIQTVRRVVALTRDPSCRAAALLVLGSALVHGLRGHDEEGAVLLHEAVQLARRTGDALTAVSALRELAYIDVQAGRAATVEARLREAAALAGQSRQLRCGIAGIEGMNRSDRGDQAAALVAFDASIEDAMSVGDMRQVAWSGALRGRSLLLVGDLDAARAAFEDSITTCRSTGWQAFLPFPLTMRAETALAAGEPLERSDHILQEAFALACELTDPCWEALACSGLARVCDRRGQADEAWSRGTDAQQRCVRHPDRYVWVEAWVLLAVIRIAQRCHREPEATAWTSVFEALCERTEQPHMAALLAR